MSNYVSGYQDRQTLKLFYRDESGTLQCDEYPAQEVAYYKTNHVTSEMRLDKRVAAITHDPHGWTRISFKPGSWQAHAVNKWSGKPGMWVPFRETACKEWGIESFEADVRPLARFLADHPFGIQKPRRVFFDIETDSRVPIEEAKLGNARVLCWTAVAEDGTKYGSILKEESDADEERILREMWLVLAEFDQVCAWNGDGFDFPVIKERSRRQGITYECIRRLLFCDQMLCFKRQNVGSSESGEEKKSFKLDHVANYLLGEGKHDVDASKAFEYWRDDPETLFLYCGNDTDLLRKIEAKTGYLDIFQLICELTSLFPETKSLLPTRQVDAFMLRIGAEQGTHFKTKWYGDTTVFDKFPGAYVMDPDVQGITRNVFRADFASLYPSIMVSYNLSQDTKDPEGHCVSPSTGLRTTNKNQGIICFALTKLLSLRKQLKAAGNKRGEKAVKIVANSFYGVTGTAYSRFYDRELCEAVTQNGVWLLKLAMSEATAKGWKVIYADTDGLDVLGPDEESFRAWIAEFNVKVAVLLREQGAIECAISLAFDKHLEHIVFTSAKRYAAKVKGDDKPLIKGLEFKRGDINALASQLQKKCIDLIVGGDFEPGTYEKIVGEYRERVATEPLSRDLVVITKTIGELEDYTTNLPQVRVARALEARGEEVSPGTKISYVIIDGRASPKVVIPASDYTGCEVDRDSLWFDSIFPCTQRLLEAAFPAHNWARWGKRPKGKTVDPRQTSLW